MAIQGGAAARAIALTALSISFEPHEVVARTDPVIGVFTDRDKSDNFGRELYPFRVLAENAAEESKQSDRASPLSKICRAVERVSADNDLPVEFFIRLIWQESKFDTQLVSRKGARGIAQFMPATAAARGLRNPFEPLQALKESGSYLRELFITFGNLGLAAAAYNAGPGRISHWLAGKARLPGETEKYVEIVTGHPINEWASATPPKWEGAEIPKDVPCDELAATLITASRDEAKVRSATLEQATAAPAASEATKEVDPAALQEAKADPSASPSERRPNADSPSEPESWGVQLAGSWEEGHVLASFERIRRQFPEIIGEHPPLVLKQRGAMGRASRYVVRISEASRQSAEALCDRLRAADGACLVLANPPDSNSTAEATTVR